MASSCIMLIPSFMKIHPRFESLFGKTNAQLRYHNRKLVRKAGDALLFLVTPCGVLRKRKTSSLARLNHSRVRKA
jgi:hypothetical protein